MPQSDNLYRSLKDIYLKLTEDLPFGCTQSYSGSPLSKLGIITDESVLIPLFRSSKNTNKSKHVETHNIVDIVSALKIAVSNESNYDRLFSFTRNIRVALFNYNAESLVYGVLRSNILRLELSCKENSCIVDIPFNTLCNVEVFIKHVLHVLDSKLAVRPERVEGYSINGFTVDLSGRKTNLHHAYSTIKDDDSKNLKRYVSYKSDAEVIVNGTVPGKFLNILDSREIIDSLKIYVVLILWGEDTFAEKYLSELLQNYEIDVELLTVLRQYTYTVDRVVERDLLCKFFQKRLSKEIPEYANPNDAIYTEVQLLLVNLPLRMYGDKYFICTEAYAFYDKVLTENIDLFNNQP